MNTDQNTFLNACERKVAPLRSIMDDLALYGGKPPIDSLEKYNAMRAEALSLDFEIAQMLPPKKGEEKKVLDAMQRLEMLVNSVQTYAQIIEGEVKQAKSNFYNNRTAIVGELEKVEARADEQILVAMRDLAKALRIKWLATEKKFRLSQYLTGLGNEFSTMGENVPPPSIIYLPWSEKIQAIQAKFNEAYLRHFLDKIGLGDGLTVESFKQKSHKPSYHHSTDSMQNLVKPPVRKPGESLGAGKQDSVIPQEHFDTHPTLQQKKHDDKKRVLPVPAPKPQKGKLIKTTDGINPKG